MTNVIIENLVQIAATLLITLIGVLGAWLSTKLAKREELKNISTATNEVIHAAQQTVLELQQTTVEGMKKAHEDGKLTKDEIIAPSPIPNTEALSTRPQKPPTTKRTPLFAARCGATMKPSPIRIAGENPARANRRCAKASMST